MSINELSDDDEEKLAELTKEITSAIEKRRLWLDEKMNEISNLKVGDKIYNLETGRFLGVISSLYRYWRDRDEGIRDTSVDFDYEYSTGGNCFDNTSRQTGLLFGSHEEAVERSKRNYERVSRM